MAHMSGPPGKKKKQTKQTNKKTVNNQMDWKLPKIKHITCKIKAWLSQETKLDVDTPSSYQFGKDVMQHRPASQMCKPSWDNPPARLLHPQLSNELCHPSELVQSSFLSLLIVCSPSRMCLTIPCVSQTLPWLTDEQMDSASPRFSCTGLTPSSWQKDLHLSFQHSKNKSGTANNNNLVLSDKGVTFWAGFFFF